MNSHGKLFLVVNVDWFFLSHRLPIALEARNRGYEVTVFAIEEGNHGEEIRNYGLNFVPLPTSRSGTNIFNELKVLLFLFKWYRKEKPDIVHHVAMKPVTYGSVAAKLAKIPRVVNALSGLGFLFINKEDNKLIHSIVNTLFKFGFRNPNLRFILQNNDDLDLIRKFNILSDRQIHLIKGSGVDLNQFHYSEEKNTSPIKVVLPSRMLWDKGVAEFVEAAKALHKKYEDKTEFILAGGVDLGNKAGIPEAQLLAWNDEGYISWIGFQSDMVSILTDAHIVVLPSYREGLPKSLIEACAIGRPIVTTNVPGCREVVDNGINGYLVKAKESIELAYRIEQLILDRTLRIEMGKAGRNKAEKEFSIQEVVDKTLAIYSE